MADKVRDPRQVFRLAITRFLPLQTCCVKCHFPTHPNLKRKPTTISPHTIQTCSKRGNEENKIKILGLYFGARKCGFQIPAIVPLMSEFV